MQAYKVHTTRSKTSLVSMARVINEQKEVIEKYQ